MVFEEGSSVVCHQYFGAASRWFGHAHIHTVPTCRGHILGVLVRWAASVIDLGAVVFALPSSFWYYGSGHSSQRCWQIHVKPPDMLFFAMPPSLRLLDVFGGCQHAKGPKFSEELWPYTPPTEDILQSNYACDMLYSTTPTPAYYVVNVNSLLGTADIMRHPCTPTIPHDGLVAANKTRGVKTKNPNASADTNPGDGTGSALFRLNAWCMQWGQRYAVTRS